MGIFTEHTALEELRKRLEGWANGGVTFELVAEEEESTDAEITVVFDGDKTPLGVQVGSGYVGLNEYMGEGAQLTVYSHGLWGVQPKDLDQLVWAIKVRLAVWDTNRKHPPL